MPATPQTSSTAEQTPIMAPPSSFPNKKSPKLRSSCDACQLGKIRCSQHKPRCQRCTNQDIVCVYSLSRRMGRPRRPMTSPIGGQEDSGAAGPQTPVAITALGGSSTNSAEDQPQQNSNLSNTLKPRPSVTMDEAEPLNRYDSHASNLNRTRHAHVQMMSTLLPGFNPTSVAVSNTNQDDLLSSPSHMFEPPTTATTSPEDFFLMEPPSPGFEHHNLIEYLDNSKFTNQIEPEPEGEMGTGSSQHQSSIKATTNTGSLDSLNLIASMYNDPDPAEKAPMFEARRHRNSMSLEIPAVGEEGMISNSWQSFTNGFFPSPTQSQVPSTTITTTSGTSTSSNFDLGESKSSSTGHRKCGCHNNLLQKLSALDEYGMEYSIPTIDHILSFEEDTRLLISQILRCSICLSQRNSLLLLLSIIIDKIVSMLERATNGKAKARRESSLAKLNSSRATSRVKKFAQCGEMGTSPTNSCPLLVGIYKVSDEETNRFLKRFLQARLCGMSVVLNQMHQSLQQSQQGGVTRAGSLITMDLQRRLQSVTGRVELWD